MRLRADIQKQKRADALVWVIRYWWPARRGERRRSKVDPQTFRDKRNAQDRASKMLREIEAFEAGRGPDPFADYSDKVIDFVPRFIVAMKAGALIQRKKKKGPPSAEHIQRVERRLRFMVDRMDLELVADLVRLESDAAERFALLQQDMIEAAEGKLRGWGAKTRDEHLTTLRQFCSWLVKLKVLFTNPLTSTVLLAGDHSKTFTRRALTVAEVGALVRAAAERRDMPMRALLWLYACYTGFRLSEISSTLWADVHLDDDLPRVELDGSRTKNKKDTVQVIPNWLADLLRPYRKLTHPTATVFPVYDWHNINRMLREDAVAAGLGEVERMRSKTRSGEWCYWDRWVDPTGERVRFDFHSLRHTYNTFVGSAPSISARDSQDLGRHADDRTNLQYWHGDRSRQHAIVNELPVPDSVCTPCVPGSRKAARGGTTAHDGKSAQG